MDAMRAVAENSNMTGICFMTVVGQNVLSQSSNQTEDFFEEPRSGMVSGFLGDKPNAMFVYDRCGRLVEELELLPFPTLPSEIAHEWNVIKRVYEQCPRCNKPSGSTQTTCPEASTTSSSTTASVDDI